MYKKYGSVAALCFFLIGFLGIHVGFGYGQVEVNARIAEMAQQVDKEQELINALRKKKNTLAKKKQRLQSIIEAENQQVREMEAAKQEQQRLKEAEEAARKEAEKRTEAQRQEEAKKALIKETEEKARIDKQIAELTQKYQELVNERKKLEREVQGEEENLKILEALKNIETEKRKKLEGQ